MQSVLITLQYALYLSLTALVTVWGLYQWRKRKLLSVARSLPQIYTRAYPIIGHLYLVRFNWIRDSSFVLRGSLDCVDCTSCFWLGPVPSIIVVRPDDIKKVLYSSKALDKPGEYRLLNFVFGNGLITAPGSIWKKSRKLLNLVFQPRNVKHIESLMNERARQLATELTQFVDQGQMDLTDHLFLIVSRNVVSLLFGTDAEIDPGSGGYHSFHRTLEGVTLAMFKRTIQFWLRWDMCFLTLNKKLLKIIDAGFAEVAGKHIQKRFREIENLKPPDATITTATMFSKDKSDHISFADVVYLLRKSNPATFGGHYIQHEAMTVIGAGTDTVHATLVVCLISLACHPDIQEKLYSEVEEVTGSRTRPVTVEDVMKMRYLEQVVKETIRKFTAVPVLGRVSTEDVVLSDCTIPANESFYINVRGLHNNPAIYPDPHVFDPDRFSAENVAKRGNFTYLPFSGGIRDCIGRHYAMLMMKITLAHLVREFSFSTQLDFNNLRFRYGITLVCADGCKVSMTKRN